METSERTKCCSSCGQEKPLSSFSIKRYNPDGINHCCKVCDRARGRHRYKNDVSYRSAAKRHQLKRNYGLSEGDYLNLLVSQDGKCSTCKSELDLGKHTHVDHCHKTGIVRGVLCSRCNHVLGKVHDSIDLLNSLISYLFSAENKGIDPSKLRIMTANKIQNLN